MRPTAEMKRGADMLPFAKMSSGLELQLTMVSAIDCNCNCAVLYCVKTDAHATTNSTRVFRYPRPVLEVEEHTSFEHGDIFHRDGPMQTPMHRPANASTCLHLPPKDSTPPLSNLPLSFAS